MFKIASISCFVIVLRAAVKPTEGYATAFSRFCFKNPIFSGGAHTHSGIIITDFRSGYYREPAARRRAFFMSLFSSDLTILPRSNISAPFGTKGLIGGFALRPRSFPVIIESARGNPILESGFSHAHTHTFVLTSRLREGGEWGKLIQLVNWKWGKFEQVEHDSRGGATRWKLHAPSTARDFFAKISRWGGAQGSNNSTNTNNLCGRKHHGARRS